MIAYFKDLLRLPSGVRRFLATESLYGLGVGMYTLVLNLHLLAQGLTAEQIGALASAGILLMGASAIPVSLLANRFGRKRLLVAGIVFIASGVLLYALGSSLAAFIPAQVLVSIGLTLVETTEVQLLFHYCKARKDEMRAYSLMFAVFTAFTGAGTLLAGRLSEAAARGEGGEGYRLPLLMAGAVLALLAVLRGIGLPKEVRHSAGDNLEYEAGAFPSNKSSSSYDASGSSPGLGARLHRLVPERRLWLFAGLLALLGAALAIISSFLNVIVKYRLEWNDNQVSQLLAANGLVLFVCSLLTPYVQERFGESRAIIFSFVIQSAVSICLFVYLPASAFAGLLLLRGGSATMLSNMADSQLMSAIADEKRNLYAGLRAVLRSIGSSVATFGSGWILAREDYRLPFLLAGVVVLLALGYYIRLVRPSWRTTDN